jgi:hypothetical protein
MEVLKQLFQSEDVNNKVEELTKDHDKALKAECESMSPELSPGVVESDELIARVLHSPYMYNLDGNELTSMAVDDVLNKGLSVNRLKFLDSDEYVFQLVRKMYDDWKSDLNNKGKEREYIGFAVANVGELRSLRDGQDLPDVQFAGVYDSAIPSATYHADACVISGFDDRYHNKIRKKNLNSLRRELLVECFQKDIRRMPV